MNRRQRQMCIRDSRGDGDDEVDPKQPAELANVVPVPAMAAVISVPTVLGMLIVAAVLVEARVA